MVVQMCYVGSREKGQEYLNALSSWDGEKCLLNEVDEKSFLHQQDSVAQVLRGKGLFISSVLLSYFDREFRLQLDVSGSSALRLFPRFLMISSMRPSWSLPILPLAAVRA
jgi:hypothetical protein